MCICSVYLRVCGVCACVHQLIPLRNQTASTIVVLTGQEGPASYNAMFSLFSFNGQQCQRETETKVPFY